MNVLVIAPHPDDESIGCGGTLRKHALSGDRISAAFLTSGELGLPQLPKASACEVREGEARAAAAALGVASTLFLRQPDGSLAERQKEVAAALRPLFERQWSVLYLPHPGEWHSDHKVCLELVQSLLPERSGLKLRGYEIWTPLTYYHRVEDITSTVRSKVRAIRAHRSQLAQLDYVRASLGLNAYRGAIAGPCRYAEVFQEFP